MYPARARHRREGARSGPSLRRSGSRRSGRQRSTAAQLADATAEYRLPARRGSRFPRAQGEGDQAMISTKRCGRGPCNPAWPIAMGWAGQGGGRGAAGDRPAQLEAFGYQPRRPSSRARATLGQSSALTAAAMRKRSQAQAYEAALLEGTAWTSPRQAAAQGDQGGASQRGVDQRARRRRPRIAQLTAELKSKAGRQTTVRPARSMSARCRPDPRRRACWVAENEALVLWMVPPGADKGWCSASARTGVGRDRLSGDYWAPRCRRSGRK